MCVVEHTLDIEHLEQYHFVQIFVLYKRKNKQEFIYQLVTATEHRQ